jgi:hypothetical protein
MFKNQGRKNENNRREEKNRDEKNEERRELKTETNRGRDLRENFGGDNIERRETRVEKQREEKKIRAEIAEKDLERGLR